ncbi:MAG: hypothetical protein WCB68_21985 [Pyrinomonadaceae bacterium]
MRYFLVLLLGLIVGALAVLFFLGPARAKAMPGAVVKAPDQGGDPPGTVVVALDEKFFDALLGTIFRDIGPPSFRLGRTKETEGEAVIRYAAFQDGGCTNTITLAPEGSNIKTGVRFAGGKMIAPLAFSGNYSVPVIGCTQFKGWAQANIDLRFDQGSQTVYGQVNVESVNLDNVNPLASGLITPFVQNVINQRVNPLEVLRPSQLNLALPVQASGGTLKTQVKDVRAEIQNGSETQGGSLRMHITYEFNANKGT